MENPEPPKTPISATAIAAQTVRLTGVLRCADLHALANDNQRDVLDCGPGYDVAYVIEHDPVTFHGCEQVVRLSPDQAAAQAAANEDND
jgi:hypothetical protein